MEKFGVDAKKMESNQLMALVSVWKKFMLIVQKILEPKEGNNERILDMKLMIWNNEACEVTNTIERTSAKLRVFNINKRYAEKLENTLENWKTELSWNDQVDELMSFTFKVLECVHTSEKELNSCFEELWKQLQKLIRKIELLYYEIQSWENHLYAKDQDFTPFLSSSHGRIADEINLIIVNNINEDGKKSNESLSEVDWMDLDSQLDYVFDKL